MDTLVWTELPTQVDPLNSVSEWLDALRSLISQAGWVEYEWSAGNWLCCGPDDSSGDRYLISSQTFSGQSGIMPPYYNATLGSDVKLSVMYGQGDLTTVSGYRRFGDNRGRLAPIVWTTFPTGHRLYMWYSSEAICIKYNDKLALFGRLVVPFTDNSVAYPATFSQVAFPVACALVAAVTYQNIPIFHCGSRAPYGNTTNQAFANVTIGTTPKQLGFPMMPTADVSYDIYMEPGGRRVMYPIIVNTDTRMLGYLRQIRIGSTDGAWPASNRPGAGYAVMAGAAGATNRMCVWLTEEP